MRSSTKLLFKSLVVAGSLALLIGCGGTDEKPADSKPAAEIPSNAPAEKPKPADHSMEILNKPPEIKSIKFVGEAQSIVQVAAEASDPDGDQVTLRYAWTINGQPAVADGDTLTGVKRGDQVQVAITPNDGKVDGPAKGLLTTIRNHSPRIDASQPNFNESNWSLQINASDADGDPLQYSLLSGPTGLMVNATTGMITWNTSGVPAGTYPVTIEVSDGQGGKTPWPFKIVLNAEPGPQATNVE